MIFNRSALLCYRMLGLIVGALLVQPTAAQTTISRDILIKGATVLTITNGVFEDTDVLVRGGKIAQIGKDLGAPSGVRAVDAKGQYLMPGIIDAHSHIALSSVNEGTSPVTSEVTMEDVVNPYHIGIYRALAGGVTTSHIMHGSANVIGGQNETIKHRWGLRNPDDLRFEGAPRTIKFALGENPTRNHGMRGSDGSRPAIRPASRMGVEAVIRDAFSNAKQYIEKWDAYRKNSITDSRLSPPEYNERLEVIADIIRGNILVHCHSYRADEILMLLGVLKDFGVTNITFQHANEGFKVAPELAAYGAGASVFADWWTYKFEVYYSTAYNATILTRNGVLTSINSDSDELDRHLYHEAAKTQRYGDLTDEEALSLITINPARQLGIASRVGSIEVGKDADLVLFNEHPLSVYAIAQKTFVDGVLYFDRDNDVDDQRLRVNPSTELDTYMEQGAGDHAIDFLSLDALLDLD